MNDLHHSAGAGGLLVMLLLASTAVGMATLTPRTELRRTMARLHTTNGLPITVKIIFAAGSAAFVVQSVSGIAMWWRGRP